MTAEYAELGTLFRGEAATVERSPPALTFDALGYIREVRAATPLD